MEETLNRKISNINAFFNYFYLNKENFSKNIQLQLNLLKPFLKFYKDFLSSFERDKLIFVQSDNINNIIINNTEENKFDSKIIKKIDSLYSIVKQFNMDLKYNKEKMKNNFKSNEIEFEKELKDINYELLLKQYEEKFGNIIKNNVNPDIKFNNGEELSKNKNLVIKYKEEIEEQAQKNKEIDLVLFDLKKKLNNYKDLPSEINQMKNLVEIKKEEYKSLLINQKDKNV